jgi:hypothetical protein
MAARPKEVAGTRRRIAEPPPATEPLAAACPDLEQWPQAWAYEPRDVPPGRAMLDCFTPFLRDLLALPLSRTTWRRHGDNVWPLGGKVIRRLQMDGTLREAPVEQVVLDLIGDDGGPLLSHGQSEVEQRSFDATCRKLFLFLTQSETRDGLH